MPVVETGGRIVSNRQVANIIFNETRSFGGSKERLLNQTLASSIMNADSEYGRSRGARAGTASSSVNLNTLKPQERAKYELISRDVSVTVVLRQIGYDPSRGATHFFFSGNPQSEHVGEKPIFAVGPFSNSFTIGDTKCEQCYASFYDPD